MNLPPTEFPGYTHWEGRIKSLMGQVGMPESQSLAVAFKQIVNEMMQAQHEAVAADREQWAEYLKDGQTPFERFQQERKDLDALMGLYQKAVAAAVPNGEVECQYSKDVGMTNHKCAGKCQYEALALTLKSELATTIDSTNDLRRVMVMRYQREEVRVGDMSHKNSIVYDHGGWLHAFGVDFEELNSGVGQYSTAIVEKDDGTIVNVPVHLVRLLGAKGKVP